MSGGIHFGPYVLLKRIARGGMAEVFLAQQRGLEGFDRRVAVKRILPHLADSPDFVKMFLGEAKLAAQLTHPNIVHIYDFGKVGGDYFIAMEYVEGVHAGQLFQLAETDRAARMSPTLVARLGADAAAALHYAHEQRAPNGKPLGLVHRDVSPANLMVSFDGVVKLCDFGIAKAAAYGDQLTNPGQVKGKYAYMSPEQTVASPLDGRSDVFSLAIVLWELLAGRTIVGRGDALESMRAIRDGKLESIASAAPGTPEPLIRAITWALETKREQRATAMDLAQALESFIKSSPELATPMQVATWVRTRFSRDATDERSAAVPGGTAAAPGTAAAALTATSGPKGLIAASRMTPFPEPEDSEIADTVTSPAPVGSMGWDADSDSRTIARKPRPAPARIASTARSTPPPAVMIATREPAAERGDPTKEDPPTRIDSRSVPAAGSAAGGTRGVIDSRSVPAAGSAAGGTRGVIDSRSVPAAGSAAGGEHGAFEVPSLVAPGGSRASQPPLPRASRPADPRTTTPGPAPAPLPGATLAPLRPPQPQPTPITASAPASSPNVRVSQRAPTTQVHRAPRRALLSIAGLVAIAAVSFALVLIVRRSSSSGGEGVVLDAASVTMTQTQTDASAQVAAARPLDAAAPDAPAAPLAPSIDAGTQLDAASVPAVLHVTTVPADATIHVGDEAQPAPATFSLPAGHYTIIAEHHGYRPERREVDVDPTEHFAQEIVFTHKLASHQPQPTTAATGSLTVKTSPYSDVFTSSGRKLGQTPFAGVDLPAGSYLLTFKNPEHAPFTQRVTIRAGETTKLSLNLP